MTTKQEGVALLQAVPLFSGLSKRELGSLWSEIREVSHAPGHEITVEGHGGVGFHVIVSGKVTVSRPGKTLRLGPGDHFGEMSLIDSQPRSATVTAETEVQTLVLSSWAFKSVAKQSPEMLWKILVFTVGRLREEQSALAALTA